MPMLRLALILFVCAAMITTTFAQPPPTCPPDFAGYLLPRLSVGRIAEILAGGTPNRVRETPGLSGVYRFDIPPGSRFIVLEGPSCSDGIVWWRVDWEGQFGWTAESNIADRNYYLQLAPADVQPAATPVPANFPLQASGRASITAETLPLLSPLPIAPLPGARLAVGQSVNALLVGRVSGDGIMLFNGGLPDLELADLSLDSPLYHLAYSPDGARMAAGVLDLVTQRYRIDLYTMTYDEAEPRFVMPPSELSVADEEVLSGLALANDTLAILATGVQGGVLALWNSDRLTERGRLALDFAPSQAVFHPAASLLAIGTNERDGETLLVNSRTLAVHDEVAATGVLAFSGAAGESLGRLFIGGRDGTISSYRLLPNAEATAATLAADTTFTSFPSDAVTAIAAHPGGTLLAVGSGVYPDGDLPEDVVPQVRFIDSQADRLEETSIRVPDALTITDLAFSADGTTLFVLAVFRSSEPGVLVIGVGG
jgi:hypothetical protein